MYQLMRFLHWFGNLEHSCFEDEAVIIVYSHAAKQITGLCIALDNIGWGGW